MFGTKLRNEFFVLDFMMNLSETVLICNIKLIQVSSFLNDFLPNFYENSLIIQKKNIAAS